MAHMIQPFLLLLLIVQLFFLPALSCRVNTFFRCDNVDYPIKVSSVNCYQGDGTRTFTLSGYTSQDLRPDEVHAYVYSHAGSYLSFRQEYPLCFVTSTCPVAAGPFVFTFTTLLSTEEPLLDVYEIGIEHKNTNLMCIRFEITTSTSTSESTL